MITLTPHQLEELSDMIGLNNSSAPVTPIEVKPFLDLLALISDPIAAKPPAADNKAPPATTYRPSLAASRALPRRRWCDPAAMGLPAGAAPGGLYRKAPR